MAFKGSILKLEHATKSMLLWKNMSKPSILFQACRTVSLPEIACPRHNVSTTGGEGDVHKSLFIPLPSCPQLSLSNVPQPVFASEKRAMLAN